MTGVLDGLKIVSMELMEAIPTATAWMADWGAEVIKVEPLTGDIFRGTTRAHGTSTGIKLGGAEVKWAFQLLNRNKRSLALDLKKESGRDILYQLIKKADVFLSNYELNSLQRLKADYASLSQINPRLIYAFVTGYGSVGPDRDEQGYDSTAGWARSGIQYSIGEPGSLPPRLPGGMVDRGIAGPHLLAGILAALLYRAKTGKGQELEVSLFRSAVWAHATTIQSAIVGTPMPKDVRSKSQNPLHIHYRTKDDRWLSFAMTQSDRYWPDFCQAIEKPELENDPRFNNMETRTQNCEELIGILDEVFASKTIEEWERLCRKRHLVYWRIQTPLEVTTDPQALANDFFVDLPHLAGRMKVVATPVKFHQNPASVRDPAPEIGQHTEEILLDLGYSWDDIAQLKEQKVIL